MVQIFDRSKMNHGGVTISLLPLWVLLVGRFGMTVGMRMVDKPGK